MKYLFVFYKTLSKTMKGETYHDDMRLNFARYFLTNFGSVEKRKLL